MRNECGIFRCVRVMVCGLVLLGVASCEKMSLGGDGGDEAEKNVVLRIDSFEQVPFGMVKTRATADICQRLNFIVYDQEGTRIRQEEQTAGDGDFGQARFALTRGHYYLVVLAHSSDGNPTSTNARRIGFTNKTGYTDTFLYADSLIVDNELIERSLGLKRIVSMVRFIFEDAVPAQADSIRFYYEGGSGTLDAGNDGWGIVKSKQTQWYEVTHQERKFDIYTIPRQDSQELTVKVTTNRGNKDDASIISEKEIAGIPIKRNHVTTCRGYLFSPVYQNDFKITIDDVWDTDTIDFPIPN